MGKPTKISSSGLPGLEADSTLTLRDAIALIVGVVMGAGIFEIPALVAANSSSGATLLLAWLLGGGISVVGALCYAELATAYPHVGGTYYYLKRAFGPSTAFLFSWARMSVLQTGSIALLAFVFGDYMSQIWRLGDASAAIYAAGAVALLTLVHYTAPVFWFFFLLSGLSLLRPRGQPPDRPQPFRVPGYPVTPLVFCLVCGYLPYSSLVYTGMGALVGVGVVALGLPLLRIVR